MAVDFFLSNVAEYPLVVSISIFTAVLCFCIVIGHVLVNSRWTNEFAVTIFIGCLSGIVILLLSRGKSSHILRFDEELFFIYLLPPIIFNAGFQVKKKQFFHNFVTIMLFGAIGVFISFSIISAGTWWLFPKIGFEGLTTWQYLALGAIFSSTDTVCTLQVLRQEETPHLYSLVFGEGVVNGATSIVLFNAIQKINASKIGGGTAFILLWDFLCLFSTSTMLGVAVGLSTAYTLKTFYFGRHSTDREVALMMLMAYLSYVVAEATFGVNFILFILVLLGRAAFVFPLSILSNKISSGPERLIITFKHQFIIWWAGLMRGAVSIALAFNLFTVSGVTWDPVHATMITSTIVIVLFTTLAIGIFTKPLVNKLIHQAQRNNQPQTSISKEDPTTPLLSIEESTESNLLKATRSLSILLESPIHTIHFYWRKFDNAYMRPVFGGPSSSGGGDR
ncbi:hypothetical protein KFK09_007004 [Dendrobium nobile]|uniref:Cation/H+ exchanger transmembrane domain-containing protein n=1 Tax=Dendrobium nobile TaxID=94219 RepID=A0A8T3BVX6_DENNO|nr:hypothetical protein KFK09_007004 [Dendrobium nobile]